LGNSGGASTGGEKEEAQLASDVGENVGRRVHNGEVRREAQRGKRKEVGKESPWVIRQWSHFESQQAFFSRSIGRGGRQP